ncbi:LSU ribosomal protein L6p (L9e) [hydrothermal vent metagenome]|uniref:LSU ribosomal protein L6p (L9e) n=1 Tax=hydrothermal vent metagenome TaxID=652676 RepID=A0A3B1DRC5_9ZZZZ
MSRIGKKPVEIPKSVNVKVEGTLIEVKGPKGELRWNFPSSMNLNIDKDMLLVSRPDDTKQKRALHGLTRSLIANMIEGVSKGYKKEMEIVGIGYKVESKGKTLVFSLGYSHPVEFVLPEGVSAEIDQKARPLKVTLVGHDKQLVGQVAANIKALRPPDAYKGKGIRYAGERLKLKPGKAGKK